MGYNDTRVTIMGVVASGVTRTTVGTGFSRAKFRMVSRERRYDRERGVWIDGDHMFLSVTCWRSLADNVHQSLTRGDPVMVTGRMTIKEIPEGQAVRQFVDIEAAAVGANLTTCTVAVTKTRPDLDDETLRKTADAAVAPDSTTPDPATPDPATPDPAPSSATTSGTAAAQAPAAQAPAAQASAAQVSAADETTPPTIVAPRREGEVRTPPAAQTEEVAPIPF